MDELLSFDLRELVAAVLAGRLSAADAVAQVKSLPAVAAAIGRDLQDDPRLDSWLDAVRAAATDLAADVLRSESQVRVLDLGTLLVAVAGLFSPELECHFGERVGVRLLKLDRPEWALTFLDAAAALDDPNEPRLRLLQHRRAAALLELHRHGEAETIGREIAERGRTRGRPADVAEGLLIQSLAQVRTSPVMVAAATARAALAQWVTLDADQRKEARDGWWFHFQVGDTSRNNSSFEEALVAFEAARQLAQQSGDARLAAFTLSEIGYTWQRAGDHTRAAGILARASDEAQAAGAPMLAARWRGTGFPKYPTAGETVADSVARAADILRTDPSKASEALEILREALSKTVGSANKTFEHIVRNAIANVYNTQGHLLQAETAIAEAIEVAHEIGDVISEMTYRINHATINSLRRRREEADAQLDEAIRLGEAARASTPSAELRQTIGVLLASAYELMAFCAVIRYQPAGAETALPQRPDRLFAAGDRARAANLSTWLALGDAVERAGNPELLDALRALRLADAELEAAAATANTPLASVAARQEQARARWETLAKAQSPPVDVPMTGATIDALTDAFPGRACLDLMSLPRGVTVAVLARGYSGEPDLVASQRESRVALLGAWHRALMRVARLDAGGRSGTEAFARDTAHLSTLSSQLDEQLTMPMVRAIEAAGHDRIVVLPHRELFQFPFWRLGHHLPGLRFTIVPDPGAALLLARRNRTMDRSWIAFGDVTRTLPYAPRELMLAPFARSLEMRSRTVLASSADARLLHFAGHGYFNSVNPYYSGLVAAEDDGDVTDPLIAPWSDGYRLLTIAWILGRLHLPACRLVVLSACYTGVPREHAASEFTSLPAAFLVAGARDVVAALWPAHDAAATLLMGAYYDALADNGAGASSDALAAARTRLKTMTRDEAIERLQGADAVPQRTIPFDAPHFADAFQHYGVD